MSVIERLLEEQKAKAEETACPDCKKAKTKKYWGCYTLKCKGCQERMISLEPCKIQRKILAESMTRWGAMPEFDMKPHCDCAFVCKKLDAMRHAKAMTKN